MSFKFQTTKKRVITQNHSPKILLTIQHEKNLIMPINTNKIEHYKPYLFFSLYVTPTEGLPPLHEFKKLHRYTLKISFTNYYLATLSKD